jgi:hypothetical protein
MSFLSYIDLFGPTFEMAKQVPLIHPQQTLQVLGKLLVQQCDLFGDDPSLTAFPYTVSSEVSLADFRAFVSALEGKTVTIRNGNFRGLTRLCDEFHFRDLAAQLSQFRKSNDFKEDETLEDLEARKRLTALEERMQQRDQEVAALQSELSQQQHNQEALLGRVARLEAEVSTVVSGPALRHSTVPTQKSAPPSIVATPPSGSAPIASSPALPRSGWNSAIVSDFPKLFEDFKKKKFALLWRGSRDGFGALEFHRRCDGHANTLTVILDTKGNIFGGFTPVKWDDSDAFKADPSLRSFLFTLKNPHNVPARRFALKAESQAQAIRSGSKSGPHFCDIVVDDNCNANTRSYTYNFGGCYTNDTGQDQYSFFTGSMNFQVKEIEVFKITD